MSTSWWFTPMPRARVAWLRTWLYAFIWLDVLVMRPWVRDHGDVPARFYKPLAAADLLHLPTPTHLLTTVVMYGLLAASLVAATGVLPRLLGATVFALYFEWMVIAFSYGKVDHDRFGFLVALAVLPTVGIALHHDRRLDERAGWAIRCIQVGVVCTYFLSVVAKARYGHGIFTWMDSTTLVRAVVRRGTFLADPLLAHPWTLHVTQYLIVAMELASPLLLVRGKVGRSVLLLYVSFHVVTFACLTIAFWPHLACLVVFLPLEQVPDRWDRLRARFGTRELTPTG
ncbi:MAG: transporter permease [Actinomycetia bacterium]|nr:transporter permease [Actinomycetes bacterium]